MHTDGTAKLTYRENFILDSDHVKHYFDSICSYDGNDIRERYSKVEKKTHGFIITLPCIEYEYFEAERGEGYII